MILRRKNRNYVKYAFHIFLSHDVTNNNHAPCTIVLAALNTVFDAVVASPLYMVIGMGISTVSTKDPRLGHYH